MKDKYSCNFYKNFDVDEQFLIENEQYVVDGVDLCKNLSEYEQGETEVLVKGRLKESVSFREKIGADSKVLESFIRVQDTIFRNSIANFIQK